MRKFYFLLALFFVFCKSGVSSAQEQSRTTPTQISREELAAIGAVQQNAVNRRVSHVIYFDRGLAYLVDLKEEVHFFPFEEYATGVVRDAPSHLGSFFIGALQGTWALAKETFYLGSDVTMGTALGLTDYMERILHVDVKGQLGVSTRDMILSWQPYSGLFKGIMNQGLISAVKTIPMAVFQSTVGNLLSGDPRKAGLFFTNTAVMMLPVPKAVQAFQKASVGVKTVVGGFAVDGSSLVLTPASALSVEGVGAMAAAGAQAGGIASADASAYFNRPMWVQRTQDYRVPKAQAVRALHNTPTENFLNGSPAVRRFASQFFDRRNTTDGVRVVDKFTGGAIADTRVSVSATGANASRGVEAYRGAPGTSLGHVAGTRPLAALADTLAKRR